jgi:hypothetical protein
MERFEALRRRAKNEREQRRGRGGKGYSEGFRKDAAICVLVALKQGVRCSLIAKGVGWATLERWLPKTKSRKSEKLLRRLSVKSQAAESQESVEVGASKLSRIVVTSSSGLMIEGLTFRRRTVIARWCERRPFVIRGSSHGNFAEYGWTFLPRLMTTFTGFDTTMKSVRGKRRNLNDELGR